MHQDMPHIGKSNEKPKYMIKQRLREWAATPPFSCLIQFSSTGINPSREECSCTSRPHLKELHCPEKQKGNHKSC